MTKTTRVALYGFLAAMGASFLLTQGCGQAFKLAEPVPQDKVLGASPSATPAPVIVQPLTIDQVANFTGKVRLARADSVDFNSFSTSTDSAVRQSVSTLFQRLLVYSPGFDATLSWYDRGWMYTSLYGIPVTETNAQNDSFILRDQSGQRLFVAPGVYAADVSAPAFQQYWIDSTRAKLSKGYRGLFIDDVNTSYVALNAQGSVATAYVGANPVALGQWQASVASFVQQIRQSLTQVEIAHGADWIGDAAGNYMSGSQTQIINSANLHVLKSGINAANVTGGTVGVMNVFKQKQFADRVHTLGKSVVLGGVPSSLPEKEYALAFYFMFSNGADFIMDNDQNPSNVFAGYNLDLGAPLGPATRTVDGVWTRQFNRGYVLLNEPGGFNQTVTTSGYRDLRGGTNSFVVGPRSGLVLIPIQ